MKILQQKNLDFKLKITTLEDLWQLKHFISNGDLIFGADTRKISLGSLRTKQVLKKIPIEIEVFKIKFEAGVLKVVGEIQNETDFTAKKQVHTLNYCVEDIIVIQKKNLFNFQKEILLRLKKQIQEKSILILLNCNEIIVVSFCDSSYKVLFSKNNLGSKKYAKINIDEEEQKWDLIKYIFKDKFKIAVVCGPFNYRDNFVKFLKEKNIKPIFTISNFDVCESSIPKVLKKLASKKIIENSQIVVQEKEVQIFLENVAKNKLFSYGFDFVLEKVEMGNCEKLFITTNFLDEAKEKNCYEKIEDIFKKCEKIKVKILIINSNFESGKIIDGFSGVVCFLRY